VTEAERALWHSVVREAKPLAGREPPPRTAPAAESAPAAAEARRKPVSGPSQLDRRGLSRLARGVTQIEARLDLHGMTQAAAHEALGRFVERCFRAGLKTLLVITGKGSRAEDEPVWHEGGVLRRSVPLWLAEPPLAARILALAPAQPRHGGGGALYVLLRRARR
jgi:DNA-nicking Smr family endonuclease